MLSQTKALLRTGAAFYIFSVVLHAAILLWSGAGSSVAAALTGWGYTVYAASCIAQASLLALVPLLFFISLALASLYRSAAVFFVSTTSLTGLALIIDAMVFAIYRFHINGMVLSMLTGDGAAQVFAFDASLWLKAGLCTAAIVAVCTALWFVARKCVGVFNRRRAGVAAAVLVVVALFANLAYAHAAFVGDGPTVKSARAIPYYYPLTANRFMASLGFEPAQRVKLGSGALESDICYPRAPIALAPTDSLPHVVVLFIDAWTHRAFTPECSPNAYAFAQRNSLFANHVSCSNGTRSSIFTTFFSVPDVYWRDFEADAVRPVLFSVLDSLGYTQRLFPSATLSNPPLGRVVFPGVPVCCSEPSGATVYDRDCRATADFCAFADTVAAQNASGHAPAPTFSFVFLDLAHSYEMPDCFKQRFTPSWSFADYSKLGPNADPEPFFNLYRNCVYQADSLVGVMLAKIDETLGAHNTLVIISGDHAQEFNENGKNFWGHNGNFSQFQIGVPLAIRFPRGKNGSAQASAPAVYTHRTTHYDLVPTILGGALGVTNPAADYSLGRQITDTTARTDWHIVGSELNFAFIAEGDTIIEKTAEGGMEVFDTHMNEVHAYRLNPAKFNQAMERMHSFYKKE